MPVYEYTALDQKGKKRSGIIDAESQVAARQKLRDAGSYPVDIAEAPQGAEQEKAKVSFRLEDWLGGVRPGQVAVVTRQLATLVGAGLPIVTALSTLIPQMANLRLKRVLAHVKDSVVEGESFAQALSAHPKVFSPLYVNMVRAGEASGAIDVVLSGLADLTERAEAIRARVRRAMAYPLIMTVVGSIILMVLMVKIVPTVTGMYEGLHQQLPGPTKLLLAVSGFLRGWWWLVIALVVLAATALSRFKRTERGRRLYDRTVLSLPLFGPLALKLATARFARTMGALLQHGVPMLSAMDITKNVVGNRLVEDAVEEAAEEIGEGRSLAGALGPKKVFPPIAVQMVDVGEQSGELEAMLLKVAELYEAEAEGTVDTLTTLLEPLLIVVMAVLVGFIVIATLMPIFEISQHVR